MFQYMARRIIQRSIRRAVIRALDWRSWGKRRQIDYVHIYNYMKRPRVKIDPQVRIIKWLILLGLTVFIAAMIHNKEAVERYYPPPAYKLIK